MTTALTPSMNSGYPCDAAGMKPGISASVGTPSGVATNPSALIPIRALISMTVLLS